MKEYQQLFVFQFLHQLLLFVYCKIAPKDEKLIARLKTMDLEAIDDIASGLPIISGTNNKDGNKPINKDAKATSEFDDIKYLLPLSGNKYLISLKSILQLSLN